MNIYTCHKKVKAFKIKNIDASVPGTEYFLENDGVWVPVSLGWYSKHQPKIGGYYVVYEDGYTSYSPAEAFESGYTLTQELDTNEQI